MQLPHETFTPKPEKRDMFWPRAMHLFLESASMTNYKKRTFASTTELNEQAINKIESKHNRGATRNPKKTSRTINLPAKKYSTIQQKFMQRNIPCSSEFLSRKRFKKRARKHFLWAGLWGRGQGQGATDIKKLMRHHMKLGMLRGLVGRLPANGPRSRATKYREPAGFQTPSKPHSQPKGQL